MSTLFGPSSAATTPVGMINRLYNGDFTFCPAGTEVVADGATVFVNWYVLTQSGTVTVSQLSYPEPGQFACMRITQSSAPAQRFGYAQRIPAEDCGDLRTALINLSGRLRFSDEANLRWAVLASTAGTLDVVNDWTSASYIPGQFFISSVEVVNQGIFRNSADAWAEIPQIPYQGPDDLVYLQLFVWAQDTVAQNGTLDAGLNQIAAGVVTQPFEHRPYELNAAIEFSPSPAWGAVITQPTIGGGQALIDAGQPLTDIASATTTTLANVDSNKVRITGTTTITSLGSASAGIFKIVRFAASLRLAYNGTSLILPGGLDIITQANDTAGFVSLGSGNWLCIWYKQQDARGVADFRDFDTGAADKTAAFNAMMAAPQKYKYMPAGTYLFGSKPTDLPDGAILFGDGYFNTDLVRNYTPGAGTDAFLAVGNTGQVRDLSISSSAGITGTGYAITVISTDADPSDWCILSNLLIRGNGAGTSSWRRAIHASGFTRTPAGFGVRDLTIENCFLFDCTEHNIFLQTGINVVILGGGVFTGTGGSVSLVTLTGDGTHKCDRVILSTNLAGSANVEYSNNVQISGNVDTAITVDANSLYGNCTASGNYAQTIASTTFSVYKDVTRLGGNSTYNFYVNGGIAFAVGQGGATPTNYLGAFGSAGGAPSLTAFGASADVDVALSPKGSGLVRYGTHAALGGESVTGYITIKDAGGTTRKIAVVS